MTVKMGCAILAMSWAVGLSALAAAGSAIANADAPMMLLAFLGLLFSSWLSAQAAIAGKKA